MKDRILEKQYCKNDHNRRLHSQNYGSGNEKLLKKNVASSIILGMMTAVVIIFAVLLFLNPILHATIMFVPNLLIPVCKIKVPQFTRDDMSAIASPF